MYVKLMDRTLCNGMPHQDQNLKILIYRGKSIFMKIR